MRDDSIDRLADGLDQYSREAVRSHSRQLARCLEEGYLSDAAVMLYTCYESAIAEACRDIEADGDGLEAHLVDQFLDDIEHDHIYGAELLDGAAAADIIDDDLYDMLDDLRQERNSHVHGHDESHENNMLDEAVDAYNRIRERSEHGLLHDLDRQPGKHWQGTRRPPRIAA
ncbi:MAG: hypothetical protein SV186_05695 [Candidatus Nanohaloarchaea archaeon]|nr:hypothetical protein [Candidatus Nanohaloarchaea archaeon]